jgi:hypothetical protein
MVPSQYKATVTEHGCTTIQLHDAVRPAVYGQHEKLLHHTDQKHKKHSCQHEFLQYGHYLSAVYWREFTENSGSQSFFVCGSSQPCSHTYGLSR